VFEEVLGLMLYHNYMSAKYNSPERQRLREMNRDLAEAHIGSIVCVDGRRGGKQQDESPTHIEPGALTKRAPRFHKRSRYESGGKHIPRSPFLRGGIHTAALDRARDLIEFPTGHFMVEPAKDEQDKHISPYQPCGKAKAMQDEGEIIDKDIINGNLAKINEITVPPITDWFNDCRGVTGRDPLDRVCLPLMMDTGTRGYVVDLDQRHRRSPLGVPELVKIYRSRIEENLGKLVGEYGSKVNWITDPEKELDLALARHEITRGLMQDQEFRGFQNDVLGYLTDHYSELTYQQRMGVLFKLADNAALVYLQGSAVGEADHPYKWHNERCIVISPEGNPPFVFFPDIQSFVATPPEPDRVVTYSNTMITIWNHYLEEARKRNGNSRMPDEILMFLTTPVTGELHRRNDSYVAAVNSSGELFHHMVSNDRIGGLFAKGELRIYSLLYDYQTRDIRAVVDNRVIASR
ncbi:hypothetical protein HYW43_03835, partial [Candidatus Daviesbacteria bacterium]|nr:hypothetical protein [Candidatus Daviesbacteria bacterium]